MDVKLFGPVHAYVLPPVALSSKVGELSEHSGELEEMLCEIANWHENVVIKQNNRRFIMIELLVKDSIMYYKRNKIRPINQVNLLNGK